MEQMQGRAVFHKQTEDLAATVAAEPEMGSRGGVAAQAALQITVEELAAMAETEEAAAEAEEVELAEAEEGAQV